MSVSREMPIVVTVSVHEYDRLAEGAECPKDYAEKLFLRHQNVPKETRRRHIWELIVAVTVLAICIALKKYGN